MRGWLAVKNFEYEALEDRWAVLRLLGEVEVGLGVPVGAALLIDRDGNMERHRPLTAWSGAISQTDGKQSASGLLWRVSFAVPLEVVEYPRSLFSLTAHERAALALPSPAHYAVCLQEDVFQRAPRTFGFGVRRQLVAMAAGFAVAASTSAVGVAAAGTTAAQAPPTLSSTTTNAHPAHAPHQKAQQQAPAVHPHSGSSAGQSQGAGKSPGKGKKSHGAGNTYGKGKPTGAAKHSHGKGARPHSHSQGEHGHGKRPHGEGGRPHGTAPGAGHSGGATTPGAGHSGGATAPGRAHSGGALTPGAAHSGGPTEPRTAALTHVSSSATTTAGPATPWSAGLAADPFTAAQLAHFSSLVATVDQPPAFLIPTYKAAGKRYHVPWQILAAINSIETDYGRDLSVSPAGAIGWMQFMPSTWLQYGVSADGKGKPNPYDPRDAIFSAARYLAASGAAHDLRRAIFAYNHALWYVDAVMWRAQMISDHAFGNHHGKSGYALPLDARYMRQLGRTDDGIDIEDAPDGAAVFSITPGIVTTVASDPNGFGPDYPVILVTSGPLAGQYIYYGHVAASLVHPGQHVVAGQPIAVMGHTGDAAGLGHGHIEIGFSDGSGDPLNHHGAAAWTPSGDAMRRVLITLSAAFGIKTS